MGEQKYRNAIGKAAKTHFEIVHHLQIYERIDLTLMVKRITDFKKLYRAVRKPKEMFLSHVTNKEKKSMAIFICKVTV